MERTIGDLGQEIRQPSNPFANLCQIAVRRSQANALKSMCPELDRAETLSLPRNAQDVGRGFIFLTPREKFPSKTTGEIAHALHSSVGVDTVCKWGRIQLPNGQVARSIFCERKQTSPNIRITRNIKVFILFGRQCVPKRDFNIIYRLS